ncbi:MAG: GH116 family glycosyl hydrolase [Bacteroidetes bacterium]|nr:GH116 family glycosyl hydrolase [Bacteroidota bacterium]
MKKHYSQLPGIVGIAVILTMHLPAISQSNRGQGMHPHTIVLSTSTKKDAKNDHLLSVGFLTDKPYEKAGQESRAAFDFLHSFGGISASVVTFRDVKSHPNQLDGFQVLWFHRSDTTEFSDEETSSRVLQTIRKYLDKGGNLLLTLDAFRYLVNLGLEANPPETRFKPCIDEGYGRKLGFHAFRDHPVFEGLNGGAYINRPVKDLTIRQTGYFDNKLPQNGKVVAVDWDYIFLREDSKLVLEYSSGKGKILAIGAYTWFSMPNYNQEHLALFIKNSLYYLATIKSTVNTFYWDYEPNKVIRCAIEKPFTYSIQHRIPESRPWKVPDDPMAIRERYSSENYWDVAGERMLTMGNENGGIEEIWAHPFMAFRDYEAGLKFDYKDTIYWLNDEKPTIIVNPSSFTRVYKFPRAYLTEIIVNDPEKPVGIVHYEYKGVYGAQIVIKIRSNLRLMWPYSEKVLGTICYTTDSVNHSFVVRDKSGNFVSVFGANCSPLQTIEGPYSGFVTNGKPEEWKGIPSNDFAVTELQRYQLTMNDCIDFVYSGSSKGYKEAADEFSIALINPYRIYQNALQHVHNLLGSKLIITSPDQDFNRGYCWALIGTDRFFVNTPGMGKSLVAGYATTRKGWDGAQKISGRPGYGWYFGRDGQWSGFALLDYGDFGKVKSELEFYQKYQDLSGKIFHEASTSGIIHYDASDATPLYIILAGRYFRYTNDTGFLRQSWPNIRRAIYFCFSTDTDKDHLIENTNVGHGWVEGGELYGSHATLYMQGCWADALEESANMAHFLKDPEGENFHMESGIIQDIINKDFWNDEGQFYSYGKNKDGSFRSEPTILPAVPLCFRMGETQRANVVLSQYASNAFTTNWGVRIIRDDSPYFKPTGYHYGSVWPLFTGWAALAEFNYGNYQQGFSHIMNNLMVYKNWGQGFVEEVLNGAEYKPSGVCAHQCWSETMVLQPAIEGLLGLDIKSQENKIVLTPHLPANWDSLSVRNIRIGNGTIDFRFERNQDQIIYMFFNKSQLPLKVEFMPSLPAGTVIKRVTMNGKVIPFTVFTTPQRVDCLMTLELKEENKIEIQYEKGICVLPVVEDPKPGDPAEGLRIISSSLKGDQYQVDVEGKAKSTEQIRVFIHGWEVAKTENGQHMGHIGDIVYFEVPFEPTGHKYVRKSLIITLK